MAALDGLPARVTVYEVGPRDGLQNEPSTVPTAVKAEFIARLVGAGLRVVEATSFVHPSWVPQLGDASELLAQVDRSGGVRYPVLVPNERGLDRALEAGVTEIAIFASATESFSQRNLNRSTAEALGMFTPVVERALSQGVWVRAYLSMCFGDPWEGPVSPERVVAAGRRLLDLGCAELSLGDTIGVGTAGQVAELLHAFGTAGIGAERLAVHFHDTYGQALANTLTALRCGVTVVDASAGGIGGCPFAGSATGNLATEDLVWFLHGLGIATGIDLDRLVATSLWMATHLGRPSPSRVVQALARSTEPPGQRGAASVVVASGHMVDAPGRPEPRFPPEAEPRVGAQVRDLLASWSIGRGDLVVCGGARGGDLIVAEQALERGAAVTLLLAYPPDEFVARSVALPGTGWVERFHAVRSRAEHILVRTEIFGAEEPGNVYARVNRWLLDYAQALGVPVHAIAVWDGQETSRAGGTADFVAQARRRGIVPTVIVPMGRET